MEAAAIAHDDHHGPPPANRSSRVDAELLGMLLFIISEIMVFGAFFTAYFFIRVVQGDEWPAEGTHLPVAIAGVNTAILLSSSLTMHWAQTSIKNGNRLGLKAGMVSTFAARPDLPLHPDQRVRPHRLRPARQRPGLGLLRPHRAARRARRRRPDAARRWSRCGPSAATSRPSTTAASRCPASTGTSSTSCGSSSTRRSTSCRRLRWAIRCAPRTPRSASCCGSSPWRSWSIAVALLVRAVT